jgi:dipeptidyl aminopeptidase/acylaminoacyl peptidase
MMVGDRVYDQRWDIAAARDFFAEPLGPPGIDLISDRNDHGVRSREISFEVRPGRQALATVIDTGQHGGPGVVLAHGGSADGRRFFIDEARSLAEHGATVILPATGGPDRADVDIMAAAVRDAVLTERRAVTCLVHLAAAVPSSLCFLGHSAGGFIGALLSAVDPRLDRIAVFGYGVGTFPRFAREDIENTGVRVDDRMAHVLDWLDPAHYVATPGTRALLIQHGRADDTVPIEEGRALYDAAAEPKRWAEYPCGHDIGVDAVATADRKEFLFA